MGADSRRKPWLLPAIRHFLGDTELEKAEYKVLVLLLLDANSEGKAWKNLSKQETETALSRKGLANALKGLKGHGLVDIEKVRPGSPLPSGRPAARVRSVYQLTEKVTGVLSTREKNTGKESTREQTALGPVNSEPKSGVLATSSLRDPDPEKIKEKKKRAHAPDRSLTVRQRLNKMSRDFLEDNPIDPHELRRLISEAVGDEIPIPQELVEILFKLERHSLIELTSLRKIEGMGWKVPTPLSILFKREPSPEGEDDVATLIALHLPKFRT